MFPLTEDPDITFVKAWAKAFFSMGNVRDPSDPVMMLNQSLGFNAERYIQNFVRSFRDAKNARIIPTDDVERHLVRINQVVQSGIVRDVDMFAGVIGKLVALLQQQPPLLLRAKRRSIELLLLAFKNTRGGEEIMVLLQFLFEQQYKQWTLHEIDGWGVRENFNLINEKIVRSNAAPHFRSLIRAA